MSQHREFVENLKQQLEDWDYQVDRFQARLGDMRTEMRDKAEAALKEVQSHRSQVKAKLDEMEKHSESAWQDLKDGVEIAWDGLRTAYYAARSEFEDDDE